MQIRKDKVVSIDYTLTNDAGQEIDTSRGKGPLGYLHGHQEIVAGLEAALEGKNQGDHFQAIVKPADAYGAHNPGLIQPVPRQMFPADPPPSVGQQFRTQSEHGVHIVRVVAVDEQNVTVDGNHPLAGQTLHFDVTVQSVRDATAEELEHGHAHVPGHGHHAH